MNKEFYLFSSRQRMSPFPNYLSTEAITKEMKKTIGVYFKRHLSIFKENMLYLCHPPKEIIRVSNEIFQKIKQNPNHFHNSVKTIDKLGPIFVDKIKQLAKKKYSELELTEIHQWFEKDYKEIYSHYYPILIVDKKLSDYLKRKYPEFFSDLIKEPRSQVLFRESYAALKLAKKIIDNNWQSIFNKKNTIKKVKSNKELANLFKIHEKNYFWITRDYEDPVLTFDDFVNRMNTILKNNPLKMLQEKKDYLKNVQNRIKQLNKKLPKKYVELFAAMREGIHLKELRKMYVSLALFYYDPILAQIAKKAGLTMRQARHIRTDDLPRLFNSQVLQNEVKQRVELSAFVTAKGSSVTKIGKDAKILLDSVLKIDKNANLLKGVTSSPGKATGRARIILNPDEISKLKKGDILVTSQIVPSFAPALKIVSGLVCDGGTSITSHPAILAREAGIPCLTGTKIALEVIKDGDILELDADKGIVKIKRN